MKRGTLKRKASLKRSPMRRSGRKSKYKRRDRDVDYMLWVKRLPCAVRTIYGPMATPCSGRVHADHAGRRGLSQKADDKTCIPLCAKHHEERTDFKGTFRSFAQVNMRAFLAGAIKGTQEAYEAHLIREGSSK